MATEQDVVSMTDIEIDEKINKLTNIVFSNNYALARQAYPLLLQLKAEQNNRITKKLEAHLKKNNSKLDDVINIG